MMLACVVQNDNHLERMAVMLLVVFAKDPSEVLPNVYHERSLIHDSGFGYLRKAHQRATKVLTIILNLYCNALTGENQHSVLLHFSLILNNVYSTVSR